MPGGTTWTSWPLVIVGTPRRVDQVLTSLRIVGEANASMIATVWPAPVNPLSVSP